MTEFSVSAHGFLPRKQSILWMLCANAGYTFVTLTFIRADTTASSLSYPLLNTVKPVLSGHSKRRQKLVYKTEYRLMQVKSIAECSPWSILQYFRPSLSYHLPLRPLFLSIFEWLLKTGFTVSFKSFSAFLIPYLLPYIIEFLFQMDSYIKFDYSDLSTTNYAFVAYL